MEYIAKAYLPVQNIENTTFDKVSNIFCLEEMLMLSALY